jgi:hypothetical protein
MFFKKKQSPPEVKLDPNSLLQLNIQFNWNLATDRVNLTLKSKIAIYGHYVQNSNLYINYFNNAPHVAETMVTGLTTVGYQDDVLNLRYPGSATQSIMGQMWFPKPIITDRIEFANSSAGTLIRFTAFYLMV